MELALFLILLALIISAFRHRPGTAALIAASIMALLAHHRKD